MERLFKLNERGTSVRLEILGGVTTFITMAYIIANGLTAGLVVFPVLKVAAGRVRELNPGSVVLGLLCLVYFLFGLPH